MTLTHHLQLVGVLMFALVLLNFEVWRRFKWRQEIRQLTLLTRQVFIVHSFFIMLSVAAFGAVSFFYPHTLLARAELARLVLIFLVVFWASRLVMQWCVYDWRLWRGDRLHTAVHFVFTGVWCYFTGVYAAALVRQFN